MTRKTGQNQRQKCAKTPTRKKCAKTTTQKKTGLTGNPKVKSQGQIFQECQGQIPMSNRKMRENHHLEKTGFNRRKVETTKWKIPRSNGENRKKAVLTGKSVTKIKKPKTLKEMSI